MMKLISFLFLAGLLLGSCSGAYVPPVNNDPFTGTPPAPDYSMPSAWAALPATDDPADKWPAQTWLKEAQNEAAADVFFIHPTSYLKKTSRSTLWNADIYDLEVNRQTDNGSILYQASVFNHSAKVYAPRYRQAFISAFWSDRKQDTEKAIDLAYSDVKLAFEYYLTHYNNGRPIIIASHSQGTIHATRLLKDFFDGTLLQGQLVAAYLAGYAVYDSSFGQIKPCENPDETGCYITWRTMARDFFPEGYVAPAVTPVCTNLLTWKTDSIYAPREFNKGGILKNFDKIIPGLCDAQCLDGVLRINEPHFRGRMFYDFKNYHIVDYNLFYINIRENAMNRVKKFLIKQ